VNNCDPNAKYAELIAARNCEARRELAAILSSYRVRQVELAERYRVAHVDPQPYTEATRATILAAAQRCAEPFDFAWTSGTTSQPKQILYPASRLRALADHYVDQILLATEAYAVSSPRFYFLNSFIQDQSVSSLLANAPLPSELAEFILGDYFSLRLSAVKLASRYSTLALCWALIWTLRPTVVTTVNPSSLCVLLSKGRDAWPHLREQVKQILAERDWQASPVSRPEEFASTRQEICDWLEETIDPPTPAEMLPQVELVWCWQGGYVRPFVEQLRTQLAPREFQLAPMFSLSTEAVAASVVPHVSRQAGLPIYSECCYEFLPLAADSTANNVIPPWELVAGEEYRMVVSDPYGLTRYDTQDVFRCVGHVQETPLIQFERRYGLNYSFTGEKITDCQLLQAYTEVARANGLESVAFTCFPSRGSRSLPGYMFVMLSSAQSTDSTAMAIQLDDALCRINFEYSSKRSTERLAAPTLVAMPAEELVAKLASALPRVATANPGQFKLLPLYALLWEELLFAKDPS
jgi:hypothetical protein